jgi:hypothetical protein
MGRTADIDPGRIGVSDRLCFSGFAGFDTDFLLALHHDYLHHSFWNVALHRVRRPAHSLKRDKGQASLQRRADSPMSMTSPMTTLTFGQYAPLLFRSSAAPHSTMPRLVDGVFLRRDLRHGADYYANLTLGIL